MARGAIGVCRRTYGAVVCPFFVFDFLSEVGRVFRDADSSTKSTDSSYTAR
jgi:hypothetical protein